MKAALTKSVKDAQLRDSFNKESFNIMKNDEAWHVISMLNKFMRANPRGATKLHTALILGPESGQILIINYEILEPAKTQWSPLRPASDVSNNDDESLQKLLSEGEVKVNEPTNVEVKEDGGDSND